MRMFVFTASYQESMIGAGPKDSEEFIKSAIETADNMDGEGTITGVSVSCRDIFKLEKAVAR